MVPLNLATLFVRDFRNLAAVALPLGERFNVLSGDNGQGKTNLLEAVYVLCTSRSFRASRPGELIAHGAERASVKGTFVEGGTSREQMVALRHGGRAVRSDGKTPATLAAYALSSPVVVFHPASLALSTAGGTERRKLLDRVALFVSPAAAADAEAYGRAVRARQRTLELRGTSARDLSDWEALMVRHGVALAAARSAGALGLATRAEAAFRRVGAPSCELTVRYIRGAPEAPEAFLAELAALRERDLRRGSPSVGPHRDDVDLRLDGHPVRSTASQGQHRAVVLALKLAEIEAIGEARGVRPLLLLDDVSSELDRDRTAALLAFMSEQWGQVILTTPRPELFDGGTLPVERRDFAVVRGEISPRGA